MTLVRDVLERDVVGWTIPNEGVAQVGAPQTPEEWQVLNYELRSFVVEGEYEAGLDRILRSYLSHLDRESQPAAWVSGFFGSGKSHLLKALAALWIDLEFPDGARASGLVRLPPELVDQLAELKTRAAQFGGRFAAAGKLDAGGSSAALSILSIVFAAAGLPTNYEAARLVLWLKKDDLLEDVNSYLAGQGRTLSGELLDMYVSDHLANAILAAKPDYAETAAEVRKGIRAGFPAVEDLERDTFLQVLEETLKATNGGEVPLSLLVLDELQLFLNDDPGKTWEMQQLIEAICAKFGSRLLVVGAGQMSLNANLNLQKLQDRFAVQVWLRDTDVSRVVRSVVLKKKPTMEAQVAEVLERAKGEVGRQFGGSAIAATAEDAAFLVSDYPLLPARRRLWDAIVRAIDTGGRATKLRTQLRDVLDATKSVAGRDLGAVVPLDSIYDQKRDEFLGTPVLPRETDQLIGDLDDGTEDGRLKARVAKVAFLFGRLPPDGAKPTGVRATDDMIIDALIADLRSERPALDPRVRAATAALVRDAVLSSVDGEYRLRNRVDAEWQADYETYRRELAADDGWIAGQRAEALKTSLESSLKGVKPVQGTSKVGRKYRLFFGDDEPKPQEDEVPVWVQTGWDVTEKLVIDRARAAGVTDETVFAFVPRAQSAELAESIVAAEAAERTVNRKAPPTTPEGTAARAGIASRRDVARQTVAALAADVLRGARVFQAGGAEVSEPVTGPTLAASIGRAVDNAVLRLYPDFGLADSAGWPKVIEAVAKGNANPMAAVGHAGEPDSHPVVKSILDALPQGGRKGSDLYKVFEAPTYGWPREAINASLLVLTLVDKVEARHNGSLVTTKQMPQNVISTVEFRPQAVTVKMGDRLAVRGLAQSLGHKTQGRDDLELARLSLGTMHELAAAAGGEAPVPARPSTERIHDLETLAGNAQLIAVAAARDELEELAAKWKAAGAAVPTRSAGWGLAARLLAHSPDLPVHGGAQASLSAIGSSRAILADPDPVAPVIDNLAAALRAALAERQAAYQAARDNAVAGLATEPDWNDLSVEEREEILKLERLDGGATAEVGTTAELLAALDSTPLGQWQFRIQAIPHQAAAALARAAAKKPAPTVEIPREPAVIHDKQELEVYLDRIRKAVEPHLDEHKTVIL